MTDKIVVPNSEGSFSSGILCGEWLYFSAYRANALFKKNIITGEQILLHKLERIVGGTEVHESAYCIGKNIFFIPFGNHRLQILRYNMEDNTCHYIDVPDATSCGRRAFIPECFETEQDIWLIPRMYGGILCINKQTYEVRRIDNWPQEICEHDLGREKFSSGVMINQKIYLCPYDSQSLVAFDTNTKEFEILCTGLKEFKYQKIVHNDGKLYLLPFSITEEIVIYDLVTGKLSKENYELPKCLENHIFYAQETFDNINIWMFPFQGNCIVKYNLKNKSAKVIELVRENKNEKCLKMEYWIASKEENTILVSMLDSESPYIIVRGDDTVIMGSVSLTTAMEIDSLMRLELLDESITESDRKTIGLTIYEKLN
ncbi:MAG: hypothetical protein J6K37_05950 [Lachnospiraceae bacterium]|nr:hypothetical protein [Lachnospiraceae bacterium]